jgi:hypothetical protein
VHLGIIGVKPFGNAPLFLGLCVIPEVVLGHAERLESHLVRGFEVETPYAGVVADRHHLEDLRLDIRQL